MRQRLLVGLSVATLVAVAIGSASTTAFGAEPASPVVGALQSCLRQSNQLLVLDLIDESGSLQQTDPSAARVVGIKAELAGLARLAAVADGGRKINVEVRLATFASDYRALWPEKAGHPTWRTLTPGSLPSLLNVVDGVRGRDSGRDTDYGTALLAGRQDLAARSADLTAAGGPPPCQAVVWFTDGQYDIEPRSSAVQNELGATVEYAPRIQLTTPQNVATAVTAGRNMLCRPGGLLDQFRRDQVRFFTVALDGQMQPSARAFLEAATQGRAGGARCGRIDRADDGVYLPVANANELLYLFGGLFDTPAEVRSCPSGGQPYCSFETYPGLSGFSITATLPSSGRALVLVDPHGRQAEIFAGNSGTVRVGGVPVSAQWLSPQAVVVDGSFGGVSNGWTGKWRLSFAQRGAGTHAQGRYTLRLRSSLVPNLLAQPRLTLGKRSQLQIGFVDSSGNSVANSPLLDAATVHASIVERGSDSETPLTVTRSGDEWVTSYAPPKGIGASSVDVRLRANFAPTPGVSLATQQQDVELALTPPPSFPHLVTTRLDLPSVRGTHPTNGQIVVAGPDRGTGCVWVDGASVQAPSGREFLGATVPNAVSKSTCLQVPAHTVKTLDVRFTPTAAGTGRASGDVAVQLQGTNGRAVRTAVPAGFDMRPNPNAARAIALFVGLLALGILLPIALLALLNWFGARFQPPQLIRYLLADVALSSDGTFSANGDTLDASPAAFAGYEHVLVNEEDVRSQRSLDVDGFHFETRALGARGERRFSLFQGPYGVVSAARPTVAGPARGSLQDFFGTHQVPLGLANTWVFAPNRTEVVADESPYYDDLDGEAERTVRGKLLLLVPTEATTLGSALARDAGTALKDRIDDLRARGAVALDEDRGLAPRIRDAVRQRKEKRSATEMPRYVPLDDDEFN